MILYRTDPKGSDAETARLFEIRLSFGTVFDNTGPKLIRMPGI
jgi:hypothetical protein